MGCDEEEGTLLKQDFFILPKRISFPAQAGRGGCSTRIHSGVFLEEKDIQSKRKKAQPTVFMRFLFAQEAGELEIQLRKRIKEASGQPRCQPEQAELGRAHIRSHQLRASAPLPSRHRVTAFWNAARRVRIPTRSG